MVLRQQVCQHPQLTGCPEGKAACLTMRQHGAASSPRAHTGANEGLPPGYAAEMDAARLQETVARFKQGIVALALARREPDGDAHHAMRGEDGASERSGRGAVDLGA